MTVVTLLLPLLLSSVAECQVQRNDWDGLTVKWTTQLDDPDAFRPLPMDINRDGGGGFTPSAHYPSCKDGPQYIGRAFTSSTAQTTGLRLLVDKQKLVVGHQMFIDTILQPIPPMYKNTFFQPIDTEYYTVTVYTVYPSRSKRNEGECSAFAKTCPVEHGVDVCTTGRDSLDSLRYPVGHGLWVQIGQLDASKPDTFNNKTLMQLPYLEQEIMQDADWTRGHCTEGIGRHYFYKMTQLTDHANMLPITPFYNGGRLNGYAFWLDHRDTTLTRRFETMSLDNLQSIMGVVPNSFYTYLSAADSMFTGSMHVYFTMYPRGTTQC